MEFVLSGNAGQRATTRPTGTRTRPVSIQAKRCLSVSLKLVARHVVNDLISPATAFKRRKYQIGAEPLREPVLTSILFTVLPIRTFDFPQLVI